MFKAMKDKEFCPAFECFYHDSCPNAWNEKARNDSGFEEWEIELVQNPHNLACYDPRDEEDRPKKIKNAPRKSRKPVV